VLRELHDSLGITDVAIKCKLTPSVGDASITSEIAYEGEKSKKVS